MCGNDQANNSQRGTYTGANLAVAGNAVENVATPRAEFTTLTALQRFLVGDGAPGCAPGCQVEAGDGEEHKVLVVVVGTVGKGHERQVGPCCRHLNHVIARQSGTETRKRVSRLGDSNHQLFAAEPA